MDEFQVATRLPHDAEAAGKFAQTIAVDKVDAREIDQKFPAAFANKNMDQVTQLRAALAQGEPAHRIHDHHAIDFSGFDLETHNFACARVCSWNHMPGGTGWQGDRSPTATTRSGLAKTCKKFHA
jgi:hypothetical protein